MAVTMRVSIGRVNQQNVCLQIHKMNANASNLNELNTEVATHIMTKTSFTRNIAKDAVRWYAVVSEIRSQERVVDIIDMK